MITSLPGMRGLPSASLRTAAAAVSLAFALGGCRGTKSVDFPVSSPPSDSAGAHRGFAQSETAMVRIDLTADRREDEPLARYLVGYNDDTLAVADAGSSCFTFLAQRPTLNGQVGSNGLRISTPHSSKSRTLRVATAEPFALAIAAIWPANTLSGRPISLRLPITAP